MAAKQEAIQAVSPHEAIARLLDGVDVSLGAPEATLELKADGHTTVRKPDGTTRSLDLDSDPTEAIDRHVARIREVVARMTRVLSSISQEQRDSLPDRRELIEAFWMVYTLEGLVSPSARGVD